MTTARQEAIGILSRLPFQEVLANAPAAKLEFLVRHTAEIIEVSEESLAFLPDVLAKTNMANTPLQRKLVKEALLVGFKRVLDEAELLSTVSEGAVH